MMAIRSSGSGGRSSVRSCQIWLLFFLCFWVFSVPNRLVAQYGDVRSLTQLFGDEIAEDALQVRMRSQRMPPERRYAYLRQQVLPQVTDRIRIAVDFLPTNPSPPVLDRYGSVEVPLLNQSGKRRVPSGGALVSPAIDLVELAGELGKLNELKTAVSRRSPVESEQVKAQFALLIIIAAAEEDWNRYAKLVTEFLTLVRESPVTDPLRAPEMVVVWQGARAVETRAEVRDLLLFLREQMRFGKYRHRERIKRHIFSLHHLLDEEVVRKNSKPPVRAVSEPLEHWHTASRDRAVTRGNGYPNAEWTTSPVRARHVSSHGADSLYYAVPLRGNFEIEGDLSTFAYREIRLTTSARNGGLRYDELKHLKADRVTQLRIARRGPVAYLIARRAETDEPQIVGRIAVGTADVSPDSLRALVHTGGAGQETAVRFISMQIHAEQIIQP